MIEPFIELPQSFLDMPRWWHEGGEWLDTLPHTTEQVCRTWDLTIDGEVMHGSNAIVIPVLRNGEPLALRMAPPDDRNTGEVAALRFWDGRGIVRLIDAETCIGASLLERLDAGRSLAALPLAHAVPVIARLMRRLAVPAPPDVPSTADLERQRLATMPAEWRHLGSPFDREILAASLDAASGLTSASPDLAVNGDLHFEQVLAGERESWLAVDPVLLRGDIEYDLARILWSRLDEMVTDDEVIHWFDVIVREAGLDHDRARSWVLFRTVDYWLWGLSYGLTEDPVRCARLARILVSDSTS
ncbi:MAG TPA: aminoglycoside phosphotransferase family protein [Thermomicrobiales bacterium]|nr:aminoglycoside phosphotransferase family protein [Thermomicrobiales bacterium]